MSVHDEVLIDAILAKPATRIIARLSFPRYAPGSHSRDSFPMTHCAGDKGITGTGGGMYVRPHGASKAYNEFQKKLKVWLKEGRAVQYREDGSGFDVVAHVEVWP
mgnify:CR=1 FL=1